MKKRVLAILISVLVISLGVFGVNALFAYRKGKKEFASPSPQVESKQPESSQNTTADLLKLDSTQPSDLVPIQNFNLRSNTSAQPSANFEKYMQQIKSTAKNPIVDAKENNIYPAGTDVVAGKNLMLVLTGYRTSLDDRVFTYGKYYLITDFVIYNLSDEDYVSNVFNFTLKDADGYTYHPTFNYDYLKGDIEGIIKPGEFRRGQFAFEITSNQLLFGIMFNTNIQSPKTVKFLVNLTDSMKKYQIDSNPQAQD